MGWIRSMCVKLVMTGPRFPAWLCKLLMDVGMGQRGKRVTPPQITPYRVTRPIQMTAAGRAIMEDGDSFSHRKTLGLDDWDDTLEGGVRHG